MPVAGLSGTGRLADDLYLLAHHEATGKPHLQPRAVGLGLAGALLAELMLAGRIVLSAGQVVAADGPAADGPVAPDALARSVLSLVAGEPRRHPARDWLVFLASTAPQDVAARLEQSGYLARVTSRLPFRAGQWVPADCDCAFAPLLRVKAALDPARSPAAQNLTLAGLSVACGLGRQLALYLPEGAHRRIQEVTGQLHPSLRELIAHTQAAVDSALLSHRK